jgi:hypothetical protein
MVAGVCYRAKIYHKGWDNGSGTHLSFGIQRTKLSGLSVDADNYISVVCKMIHAQDNEKDKKVGLSVDWKNLGS